jgi:hypothetical protein
MVMVVINFEVVLASEKLNDLTAVKDVVDDDYQSQGAANGFMKGIIRQLIGQAYQHE